MVNLLIAPDGGRAAACLVSSARSWTRPAARAACSRAAEDHIKALNPDATVEVFGQELNPESWAICRSDLMIKGQDPENIVFGNSFSDDGHSRRKFDYMLANPPFGVEWKKVKDEVEYEHKTLGDAGRFGAGLPRINDGSLLFLQHMISKMKPVDVNGGGGSRIAIVFNGSPLFTGAAELGRVGDPPLDPGERLAGGDRRAPGPALLQHRHLDVLLDPDEPQGTGRTRARSCCWTPATSGRRCASRWATSARSSATDAASQAHHPAVRATRSPPPANPEHPLHGKVKVFAQLGLRLPTHHRGAAAEAPLRGDGGDAGSAGRRPSRWRSWRRREEFVAAVRPLLGSSWATKAEALVALKDAVVAAGLLWPVGRAVREGGTRDRRGTRPRGRGAERQGRARAGPGTAGLRERAAGRGRGGVPQARGAPARAGRVDRPQQRRRSGTRSRSRGTFTCTSRRGRWRRSTPS